MCDVWDGRCISFDLAYSITSIVICDRVSVNQAFGFEIDFEIRPKTLPTAYSSENVFFTLKCCMMSVEHGYEV